MGKTLLSISTQSRTQDFVLAIAAKVGMKPVIVSTPKAAIDHLKQGEVGSVFVEVGKEADLTTFESALQESVGLFSDLVNPNLTHFICPLDLESVPFLLQSPLFGHYIRPSAQPATSAIQDAELYSKVVAATLLNMKGIGTKELLNQGAQVQNVRLEGAAQKADMIQALRTYLAAAQFSSRVIASITNGVDEILLNALHTAPVNDEARGFISGHAQKAQPSAQNRNHVEVELGFDGTAVAISVRDHYGTLDRSRLLAHMPRQYQKQEYRAGSRLSMSGLGIPVMMNSHGSFIFSCDAHEQTVVTAVFRKTQNFREFQTQFRFLSTQFFF